MKKNYYGNHFNNTPRHASRRETLASAGINSDQYLSMRIDKEFIPDGAEVVIQVRDKETGEVRYVPFNQAMDDCFGKNSQFYRQEMSDGHIFNPYIHRRWLPAQFRRNIREAGYNGIYDYVKRCYNWNYVVRFLKQECWKLAMLQRRDHLAVRHDGAVVPEAGEPALVGNFRGREAKFAHALRGHAAGRCDGTPAPSKARMKEGDRVVASGSIDVYIQQGRYQLYARRIELQGAGLLYERFLALKAELEENKKRGGGGTIHFMDEIPEYKEIYEKHRVEDEKLEKYREECKDEAIDMLKEYFFSLWD